MIYIFGCNPSLFQVGLYPYIATYHKQYPSIKIHIISKPASDLITMLENHELDMVIRKFGIETTFRNFSVKIASQITHCFFCNEKYKNLSLKKQVSLEELSNYPLLVLNQSSYERRALDYDFKKQNVKLEPIMDFTYHAPIVYLVKLGYGIGYTLKEAIQNDLDSKELYQINVNQISSMHNLGIVYNSKYLSTAANKLIAMI
ncbi:MAG: LysR family transcriptional regulator substrate-binding protein [Clostridia bacterium]|nr:LysR family transcriptional regulator substrate-binding protein [Clostridia bacterium]